ncbi:hypothetical protein FAUST_10982 [Fusarium austroamericanum]|uniref:Uncharacterized protein n=1 Tax=Fusarium austroamericanum TaxID=282268 RepID=A0AAN5Z0K2_FUSAU|nr:hypothetical protein FAUST_10982 [Fusarium austroamericanum]
MFSPVLRCFDPNIFPGMLAAFARILDVALDEMERRFREETNSRGLGMALSEAVAALDRIGNYCFTGEPRVLPTKVPETVHFVRQQASRRLRGTTNSEILKAVESWSSSASPFRVSYVPSSSSVVVIVVAFPLPPGYREILLLTDGLYLQKTGRNLQKAIRHPNAKGIPPLKCFAPSNSQWPIILGSAIRHAPQHSAVEEMWISGIANALSENHIEWVPGIWRNAILHSYIFKLLGEVSTPRPLAAPPNSFKRRALEADARLKAESELRKRPKLRREIHLGYDIPFTEVPEVIVTGFAQSISANHDEKAQAHYRLAQLILGQRIGTPECDLLLLLVLTLAASSEMPGVRVGRMADGLITVKRKNPCLFAASLVVRLLWYLQPLSFPQTKEEEDQQGILRTGEMAKKVESNVGILWLEHKGADDRLVVVLG